MWLTNKNYSDILQPKSRDFKQKGVNMFIYENLNEFEENEKNNELAVSPLAYVVLDCGR